MRGFGRSRCAQVAPGADAPGAPAFVTDRRAINSRNRGMNRAPVLFRVDATARQGWESLWRCVTLANALQRRRRPAYFLSQLEPGSLGLTLKRAGNEWLEAGYPAGSEEDLDETRKE